MRCISSSLVHIQLKWSPLSLPPAAPSYCIHYTPHHRAACGRCRGGRRRPPPPTQARLAHGSPCILHSQCGRGRSSPTLTADARTDDVAVRLAVNGGRRIGSEGGLVLHDSSSGYPPNKSEGQSIFSVQIRLGPSPPPKPGHPSTLDKRASYVICSGYS